MFLNFARKSKKVLLFFINISLFAVIILLLFYTISCKVTANADDVGPAGKKLIVGCDDTYPPFEFVKDGNIDGFDIDIAIEIAKRMDREIEIISINWDSTYQIPEDLKFDMIISAIPIIEGKEGVIDFSSPYFVMEYMLITLSETDIKIKEDLKGKAIGILKTEKNCLSEDYLLNYKIESYEDIVTMLDDLGNKNIDGVLISLPIGVNLLVENKGIYSVLEVVKSNKEFGIVFTKGSALKEEVDKILEEIKEDGTYDDIYKKWFNYSS
ncbi:MAG: amino acid ABC transporter substrate-binding protein [Chloroflexi bacterium]|nr:amino acid ABC transporter substrate-binding protein [Chloroflexota bacterium]MBE3114117.1 amino acid ABC transporter substrate-binding protein [Actinomycetota bacterium]